MGGPKNEAAAFWSWVMTACHSFILLLWDSGLNKAGIAFGPAARGAGWEDIKESLMWTLYSDILELSPTRPLWWDEHAVPRFCPFSPDRMASIYANEAALLLIRCAFGPIHYFVAAISGSRQSGRMLADEIRAGTLGYGDPPSIAECGNGDANSLAIRVLQYWRYDRQLGPPIWIRDPSLEIVLDPTAEQRPPRNITWGDYDVR